MKQFKNIKQYGVYAVVVGDVIRYVGSGDIRDCISRHKTMLKNGGYNNTNKQILQDAYDAGDKIEYKTLRYISNDINNPQIKKAEDYYIKKYKATICNKNKAGRPLRNQNDELARIRESINRSLANQGTNNPHCNTDTGNIVKIKAMLAMGMRNKDIAEIMGVNSVYVSKIKLVLNGHMLY